MSAQHSMQTEDHGSPPPFIELARRAMGRIDFDPASSLVANENVKAKRIITKAEDFWKTPWFPGAPPPCRLRTEPLVAPEKLYQTVFLNPPGDKRGLLVARAWWALTEYFALGWISSAVWVGFNIEQLSRLQRVGARTHPLAEMTVVPRVREDFVDLATGVLQEDAPHASFVTLLTRLRPVRERFAIHGAELGHVVNGDRR